MLVIRETAQPLLAGVVVACWLHWLAGAVWAADEEGSEENWVMKGSDPSELVSRLELRNEYLDFPETGHSNATFLRGDYALLEERWLVKLEIPLVDAKNEEFGSHFGLSDLILGTRVKAPLGKTVSWIAGTDFILNTASKDVLGSGKDVISPLTSLVWKPSRPWILALTYHYFDSFAGDERREDIRESLFRPGAFYNFSKGFWLWLDPHIYINHEHHDDTALFLEGEFGKVAAPHVELWLRGGGNVTGEGREEREGWKAEVGIRYLFD